MICNIRYIANNVEYTDTFINIRQCIYSRSCLHKLNAYSKMYSVQVFIQNVLYQLSEFLFKKVI